VNAAREMSTSGKMTIVRGRLRNLVRTRDEHWRIDLIDGEPLSADAVINCTGVGCDALIDTLMKSGQLTPIGRGTAPLVSTDLRAVAPDRRVHSNLFCIGPATALALGDVLGATSVARQAEQLAKTLSARTHPVSRG